MSQHQWTAVDQYLTDLLIPSDPILDAVLANSDAADLPAINVAPNQGKLLMLLAMLHQSRSILEIGTLGGYSTIWLARALPADGRIITLEAEPHHAKVAKANIAQAGFADQVEVRLGFASETLSQIASEGHAPFDLIFIDADKPSNPIYFEWALKLSRPGSLIIVDNVVRGGAVTQANSFDESVQGVRRVMDMIANEPRVTSTAIQTVGSKGYDGFALLIVNDV